LPAGGRPVQIVVVDVRFIAFSAHSGLDKPRGETTPNMVTVWFVSGLALFETHGLFSFMSGVGLALLMRSWARQSLNLGRLYRNRMIGLRILRIARECFSLLRSSVRSPR
jgi:uncharacterized membrane protein YeiB